MTKYKFLAISALFFTILLPGCNDSKNGEKAIDKNKNTTEQIKQEIPEPYIKAITAINNKDWELANTYLDLVISDFPDSEYIFPTQTLKGSMQLSQYTGTLDLLRILNSGVDRKSSLHDEEDLTNLRHQLDLMKEFFGKSTAEQTATFKYVVQTFKTSKDYTEYYKDIKPVLADDAFSNNLSFFENVGYPVPTDSEIKKFTDTKYDNNISYILNEMTNKPEHLNYNYIPLFYNTGIALNEKEPKLAEDLFNLILDLTSQDTYNEYRISVEKLLKNINNEVNQN